MFSNFLTVETAERLGIPFVFTVMLFIYMRWQSKQMNVQNNMLLDRFSKTNKEMISFLSKIAENVGRTFLTKAQAFSILKNMFRLHILKKIDIVRDILEENDIVNRELQIKSNIKSSFVEISRAGAATLNEYNTEIGKLGDVFLDLIAWDEFLSKVYSIMFNQTLTIKLKLKDLEILMEGYVSDILAEYEHLYCPSDRKKSTIE